MVLQDRRTDDAEPLLLKLGVSLAVPLAAYIISAIRLRTANGGNNSKKPPTGNRCSLPATFGCSRGLKDALHVHQNGVALFSIIHGISATPSATTSVDLASAETGIAGEKFRCCSKTSEIAGRLLSDESNQSSDPLCPPAIACSDGGEEEEEDVLLLQDVNLQQSDQEPAEATNEPSAPESTADSPLSAQPDIKEVEEEQELACLSDLFQSLWERDTLLQIQMLERHGRKEHEDAVRDLENRLRMSATEAEHLQAKVESLQQENEMLNLQVSQFLVNMEELESEKAKAKHLKRKLKSERTHARASSGSLEQRIGMLQEKLQKMEQDEAEARNHLERLRGVEAEVAELRMRNLALSRENLDLSRRLESAQTAAVSCSHDETSQKNVQQEANRPRETGGTGRPENKVGKLEADHFGDEEFMYLRWLSARLRYETKKHALLPWKTKLGSKSKSPESENTAAKLAFDDGAKSARSDQKNSDFSRHLDDMECCYSPEGCHAARDGGAATDHKPPLKVDASSRKPKLFRKFKKLLTRRSGENNKVSPMMMAAADEHCDPPPEGRESVSTRSGSIDSVASAGFITVENSVRGARSHEDDNWQKDSAWIQASYRSPRNVPKARSMPGAEEDNNTKVAHCMSDLGASINFMRTTTNGGGQPTDVESQPKILGR